MKIMGFKMRMNIRKLLHPIFDICDLKISLYYYFSGSLLQYSMDPRVFLVGASAGVYALLTAHLANIFLVGIFNFTTLSCQKSTQIFQDFC